VKLLLDQNLSRRLVPARDRHFSGTSQVALIELDKATDFYLWKYAADNEYIIVTKDSDFEALSVLYGAPPKVIRIKLGNANNKTILKAFAYSDEDERSTTS